MQAQRGGPSLTTPCHLPTGFSTIAQLKRRNTLKDGIIMIQTLLIILFIIVPIFLLLDKVTTGARGAAMGQARRGQGLHLPSPIACPLTPVQTLLHSFGCSGRGHLTSSPLAPHPQPLPQGQSPWPSPAWPSSGWGGGR